jgi:hypothetical protein
MAGEAQRRAPGTQSLFGTRGFSSPLNSPRVFRIALENPAARFIRMLRARILLILACLFSALSLRAQVVLSNFNTNDEGWLAYAGGDPTTSLSYSSAGGVGGTGAVVLNEPANGQNDYFLAPGTFLGNMSAYYNGTLSFALKLDNSWGGAEAAMVILTGASMSIGFLPASTANYPITTAFTVYTVNLNTTTAWVHTDASDMTTGATATALEIQSILGNLTSVRILGDWSNSPDHDLLDNVTLAAIPEPSALEFASLTGLAGGLIAIRRRVKKN